MAVDHNPHIVFPCPLDCFVEIVLCALDVGRALIEGTESPVANGNAEGVEAPARGFSDVGLGVPSRPVLLQLGFGTIGGIEGPLVDGAGAVEQAWRHPLFEDEPAAEVDAAENAWLRPCAWNR